MKNWQNLLLKVLYPKTFLIVLFTICNTVLLIYIFMDGKEQSPLAYVVYPWAAYTLTVICMKVPRVMKKIRNGIYRNTFGNRFMTDTWFRVKFTLHLSLAINVIYSVFKFTVGLYLSSVWLVAVAVYYVILSVIRYVLLRHMKRNGQMQDIVAEHRKARVCGWLLVFVNLALSGMVVQMIWRKESYSYPGFLVFAAAAYAFYCVTMSVISIVRYRKKNSPVLSSAKAISLVAALVSILALQTALITQFGTGDETFQHIMNSATGGLVCVSVMAIAIYMIVISSKKIKLLEESKGIL